MDVFVTDKPMSRHMIQMQYYAINNLCSAFNLAVKSATLRFYPYGGCLYKYFMPNNTSKYTQTNDVDGFLVVMPNDVSLQDCLRTDASNNVVEKILDVYKELFESVFTPEGLTQWLQAASNDDYTLTCAELFQPKGNIGDPASDFWSSEWDKDMVRYRLEHGEIFEMALPLRIEYDDISAGLDVHFGVLQPPIESITARLCEIVYTAQPDQRYTHMYVQSAETFFVEQCATMLYSLQTLYEYVILHPDVGTKLHDERMGKLTYSQIYGQPIIKAEKRMMRIQELADAFSKISQKPLKYFYSIHENDVFKPFIDNIKNKREHTHELFQPYVLQNRVRTLNDTLLYGYHGEDNRKNEKRTQNRSRASLQEATQSSLAVAMKKPLKIMMDIMHIREANALTNALVLTDDVTVQEMMHLLIYLFERLRDKISAAAERGAAFAAKKRSKRKVYLKF